MLELVDVSKSYAGMPEDVEIFRDVNLSIEPGQSVSIMGPSGSGKTTLLNLMGGLDKPTTGKVMLSRTNLRSLREGELARTRNGKIGFVFQLHYLLPQCTVLENVMLPALATRKSKLELQTVRKRAKELLEQTGMENYADALPGRLSGGQRQRAAVVRALINQPKVVLADEPTGSLDAATAEQIGDLLMEISRSESVILVIATHSERLAIKTQRQCVLMHKTLTELK